MAFQKIPANRIPSARKCAMALDKAAALNTAYELSPIRSSAADEVFHRNQPILSVVDIESRFCALLARADDRDHETWGIHLLDLQARGYAGSVAVRQDGRANTIVTYCL